MKKGVTMEEVNVPRIMIIFFSVLIVVVIILFGIIITLTLFG